MVGGTDSAWMGMEGLVGVRRIYFFEVLRAFMMRNRSGFWDVVRDLAVDYGG